MSKLWGAKLPVSMLVGVNTRYVIVVNRVLGLHSQVFRSQTFFLQRLVILYIKYPTNYTHEKLSDHQET